MSKTIVALTALATATFGSNVAAEDPAYPFAEEITVFGIEDEIFPPASCSTLFVGSSSIRFWFTLADDFPDREVVRRGYGGSTIADTNHYFDKILAGRHPRAIVFYAGENDIHNGMPSQDVLTDFQTFLNQKDDALGNTPVYFVSIKPSKARIADLPAQKEANRLITELSRERPDLVYVDVASLMMQDDKPKDIFINDDLHMNHEGYAIWRDVIGAALKGAKTTNAPNCP